MGGVMPAQHTTATIGRNAGQQAWDHPIPLVGTAALPRFPVDALPPVFASYVAGLATATQTPVDLPGTLVLAALAAAAGGRAVVQPRPGWREPTNLFIGTAMAPGNRKSAVVQHVTAPLQVAERVRVEAVAGEIADAQFDREIADGHVREASRKASRARANGDADAAELHRAAKDAAALAERSPYRSCRASSLTTARPRPWRRSWPLRADASR
jgi:hypothetical protein